MLRRFSADFALFSIALDFFLVLTSLLLSSSLRVYFSFLPFVKDIEAPVQMPWLLYLLFPAIWVGILLSFSVYDSRRNLRLAAELGSLTLGCLLATISIAGVLYLTFREVSRFLFLFFAILSFGLLVFWRLVLRYGLRWNILGRSYRRRLLILGAGKAGRSLLSQMLNQPDLGIRLIGFLDDDPQKQAGELDVLGPLDVARDVIRQNHVDDVVIALPRSAYVRLNQVASELHDMAVRVWVIPDYFSLAMHRATVEEFAGIPMLDLRAPALSEYQRMIKRAFDLALSLLLLPFFIPIVGLIALAIWLDNPGPVFFRQRRVGENGRLFEMIKFRTMVVEADALRHLVEHFDDQGRLIHKVRDDPRVTPIGRFLRKTSLDELPQLINVLKGEMSLVGPRPELPYLVEKYESWQRKRFAVPQGVTGWWQVNGRSDKPMHLHTEDDLYYVQHYSIWLDLKILLMTAGVVLRGKGAY